MLGTERISWRIYKGEWAGSISKATGLDEYGVRSGPRGSMLCAVTFSRDLEGVNDTKADSSREMDVLVVVILL
jgi:hypothetical protein